MLNLLKYLLFITFLKFRSDDFNNKRDLGTNFNIFNHTSITFLLILEKLLKLPKVI